MAGRIPGSFRRGFTLTELLVVIAVTALLGALVLAGVRSALHSVRKNQCLQNMRQVGVAFHLYAADHHGALPVQTEARATSNSATASWSGQLSPYTDGYTLMACTEYEKTADPRPPVTFLYNGWASTKMMPASSPAVRLSQSKNPARDVLMIEQRTATLGTAQTADIANSPYAWCYPHAGPATAGIPDPAQPDNVLRSVLYVDGHVNFRGPDIPSANWRWPEQ